MANTNRFSGDQGTLRKVNLTAVLNCLRQYAPISRATLAKMTGLNKATITRLIRDLIDYGFVRETGTQSSVTGRPSIMLELDPEGGYIIGARLDVDYSSVILTDFSANILWRSEAKHHWNDDPNDIQTNLLKLIQQACKQVPQTNRPLLGLGVSMPGLVDVANGTLLFAPNLGWQDVPIKDWLNDHFNFPVYVDNEANLAALGESYFGVAQDSDYVLYINITAGVGAGIVLNKQILPGTTGLAGEVGHVTVDPQGPRCNCGNIGCWETFGGGLSIFRRMKEFISAGASSSISNNTLEHFNRQSIPLVVEAAEQGDEVARKALQETGKYIGLGIANLVNVFNPHQVVLGGYLSPAYEMMLSEIVSVVQERALKWSWEASEIVIAEYGSDASLMGAIATIYDHVLSFPIETLERSTRLGANEGGA